MGSRQFRLDYGAHAGGFAGRFTGKGEAIEYVNSHFVGSVGNVLNEMTGEAESRMVTLDVCSAISVR